MPDTVTVGEVRITALLDVPDWHLHGFFAAANPDPETWELYRKLYPEALCDGTAICTTATGYLVRTAGQAIVVDTGLGPGPHERAGGRTGHLLEELQAAGARPEDVDLVLITHLHVDHVGWNGIEREGRVEPVFANARYLVPEADWHHYRQPERLERAPYLLPTLALFDQGLVDLVSGERSVGPNLTLLPTPGHTPGHQAVLVFSNGERAAIIGDMAHSPAQVQETSWSPGADTDPVLSAQTRAGVFERIESEGSLLCAGHFPHPGFGYLVRQNGRRLFRAAKLA